MSPMGAHVHKTTYEPVIDMALPVRNAFDGTHLTAQCHFTGPKKSLDFQGSAPSTCPRNAFIRIKSIMYWAV